MAPKIFDRVGLNKPRYSAFDLSREQKLSAKMGFLYPTYLEEIIPGDNFQVRTETLVRLAPMIAPVMHRVNLYMHYFFVPNRIIWNQWEDFITGGKDGTSEPTYPIINSGTSDNQIGTLRDYLGIPVGQGLGGAAEVSALPFRAYQLIWNEYFRDENLQDEIDVNTADSTDLNTLRKRAWEKDYFTSSLPWPQRGEAVGVPLDSTYAEHTRVVDASDGSNVTAGEDVRTYASEGESRLRTASELEGLRIENLEEDIGIDINDLRRSSALQRWLEKSARGGYRYIETILAHFGVKSDDARLQRPEYLGGGRQPIIISEVLNTTGTETAPQGDMAGHGISSGTTNSFRRYFNEHGYVMGILSVLPRTAYQQGIPRHLSRRDRFDYYWPEFADLGEQEVKNKEIYFDPGEDEYNEGTFGYQQRYAEYKHGHSTVHGDFRKDLDFWHMSRVFDSQVALNEEFVEADPTNRIYAVTQDDPDHLWIQMYHSVKARRPMPYFSNPKLT